MMKAIRDCLGLGRKDPPQISAPFEMPDTRPDITDPPRLPPMPPRADSLLLSDDVRQFLHKYGNAMEKAEAKKAREDALRMKLQTWGASVRSFVRPPTPPKSVSEESFGTDCPPRPSGSTFRRQESFPEDAVQAPQDTSRLSYEQKGKWKQGHPPAPQRVSLPEMSLSGHAKTMSDCHSSGSSSSSRYSTYYG